MPACPVAPGFGASYAWPGCSLRLAGLLGYRGGMRPRFNGIALISDDVPGLSAFYAGLLQATMEGDGTFAFIRGPGAVLSVFSRAGMEAMVPGSMDGAGSGSFTIEFEVDDVDARHEQLLGSGTRILKPPTTQPWGRRSLWLRDPDGNIVNLYQQARS
jgi:predicted enzyme related to lactoylglutathione lyase